MSVFLEDIKKDLLIEATKENPIRCAKTKGSYVFGEHLELPKYMDEKYNSTIVFGSPGSGKTRYFMLPNILKQKKGLMFIFDPNGTLYQKSEAALKKHGFKLKKFHIHSLEENDSYNPFQNMKMENYKTKQKKMLYSFFGKPSDEWRLYFDDVQELSSTILLDHDKENDFWSLYTSRLCSLFILYMSEIFPTNEWNFNNLEGMIRDALEEELILKLRYIVKTLQKKGKYMDVISTYEGLIESASNKTLRDCCIYIQGVLQRYAEQDKLSKDSMSLEEIPTTKENIAWFVIGYPVQKANLYLGLGLYLFKQFQEALFYRWDTNYEQTHPEVNVYIDDLQAWGYIPSLLNLMYKPTNGKNFQLSMDMSYPNIFNRIYEVDSFLFYTSNYLLYMNKPMTSDAIALFLDALGVRLTDKKLKQPFSGDWFPIKDKNHCLLIDVKNRKMYLSKKLEIAKDPSMETNEEVHSDHAC